MRKIVFHRIDLQNQDIKKDNLRLIRKNLDSDDPIEIRTGEVDEWYKIYRKCILRKRRLPYSKKRIKGLGGELLLAMYGNRVIAGSLFIRDGEYIHYLLNASDPKYKSFNPNHLILGEAIRRYKDFKYLELGPTPQGDSLEIFKKGWGGEEFRTIEIEKFKLLKKIIGGKLKVNNN